MVVYPILHPDVTNPLAQIIGLSLFNNALTSLFVEVMLMLCNFHVGKVLVN